MLSSKDKKFLKSQCNQLKATITIGKEGLNHNVIKNIILDLEAHELVKIDVLKTADVDFKSLPIDLASQTGATIIQEIGRSIVLYKESKKHIYLK